MRYGVNICAPGRIVKLRIRLEVKIRNIQLVPRRKVPISKSANAEILAEVSGRVIDNACRDHCGGVGLTIKRAGGAGGSGVGSLPWQTSSQRVSNPRRTSRPRRHD